MREIYDFPLRGKIAQMWVWPQVPFGGRPATPLRPRTPPLLTAWAAPSRSLAKRAKGGGGKREGEHGEGMGFGLREGCSNYNGGWGGTLQTLVGARPTSGGSQFFASKDVWRVQGCFEL